MRAEMESMRDKLHESAEEIAKMTDYGQGLEFEYENIINKNSELAKMLEGTESKL